VKYVLATYKPGCYFLVEETWVIAEITPDPLSQGDGSLRMTWCNSGLEEYFYGLEEVNNIYGIENWPFVV
jgi:hypothetical protein